jgi:hypothetical protein
MGDAEVNGFELVTFSRAPNGDWLISARQKPTDDKREP